MRDEISKIEKEKSAFSAKVNAFNQAKSNIQKGLSTEQEKFNNADGQIKTSQKRLILIDKRLPEITNELEIIRMYELLLVHSKGNQKMNG